MLVLPAGSDQWDRSKPLGCSSKRRILQLQRLYPEVRASLIRGNVQTRLRKLDEGRYGAIVLAAAGLKRLGLEDRISRYFSPEEMLPAAGQGILAVQGRAVWTTATYMDFLTRQPGPAPGPSGLSGPWTAAPPPWGPMESSREIPWCSPACSAGRTAETFGGLPFRGPAREAEAGEDLAQSMEGCAWRVRFGWWEPAPSDRGW